MTQKDNSEARFTFRGAPLFMLILTWPPIILIAGLIFAAFFVQGNWFVKAVCVILPVLIGYFILKKGILYVKFTDQNILVKRPIGSVEVYDFDDVDYFIFNREGFLPYDVILAKRRKQKKKMFHFYCPLPELDRFKKYLNSFDHKIYPQK